MIDAPAINYGNLTTNIDFDVEDFQIPGSAGIKLYNWSTSTVDLSGLGTNVSEFGPYVYSLNNVLWNYASALTTFVTKGQVGEIAGW